MARASNTALLIAALLLLPALSRGVASAQQSPPKTASQCSPQDQPPNAAAKKSKSGAKKCGADKSHPCAETSPSPDAPTPNASKSQADQFAFPEDVSRKAAQAAASGLPDDASPNAPTADAPSPAAPSSGSSPNGANPMAPGSPPAATPASAHPFPAPGGKAASTPGWGGLRRRDPTPADPASSSSSSSSPAAADPNNPAAPAATNLQLQDAGSSGQMIDSYRAENDDDVADFYNKQGNYLGAYLRYQDAVHFNPDDEAAQYGLAEMAVKTGRTQEAIAQYKLYLKLFPSGDKTKAVDRALKKLNVSPSER